jgi:hypothetical protein
MDGRKKIEFLLNPWQETFFSGGVDNSFFPRRSGGAISSGGKNSRSKSDGD